jgi:hypothetical protein
VWTLLKGDEERKDMVVEAWRGRRRTSTRSNSLHLELRHEFTKDVPAGLFGNRWADQKRKVRKGCG